MAVPIQPGLPTNPNEPSGGDGGGTPAPATSYGTTVFNRAFAKLDAASALDFTVYLNCYSPDDLDFTAHLFVDDVLVQTGSTRTPFDNANSRGQLTTTLVAIVDGVDPGPHTVTVRVKNRVGNFALQVLPGSLIKITELRQAAR